MEHQNPTHIVCFDHPNSLMPSGYGTATVDDGDEDEILRQAIETNPHHKDATEEEIEEARETATIYRVPQRHETIISSHALAILEENAVQDLPYCEGEHKEELTAAIAKARESVRE